MSSKMTEHIFFKHMIWAIFNLLFNCCYIDSTVAYIHVLFFPGNCWSFFGVPVSPAAAAAMF